MRIAVPALFGATLLVLWESLVRHFEVLPVILLPPSQVWVTLTGSLDILWGDFRQTVLKGALRGYVIGGRRFWRRRC